MNNLSWLAIRPAWILAVLILAGWIVGSVGDLYTVCPKSIPPVCANATYFLAQNNAIVVFLHQYFQLFTAILVTDSPLDAAFNAIAVLVIDRLTEDTFNKARYFAIFFLTALLGNLFTLLEGPNYPPSAGASGGIFGIIAAIFAYSWARERRVELTALVFFVFVFVGSSFLISNVNWVAHMGGAIGGFICGPVLYYELKNRGDDLGASRSSNPTNLLVAALLLLIAVLSAVQFWLFVE